MLKSTVQGLRRFFGTSDNLRADGTWHNWGDNQQCKPSNYFEPISVDALVGIVNDARRASRRIRIAGAGHSWSDIVCTNDWLVSLVHINALIDLDVEKRRVTVQAGMRVADLAEQLDAAGLALVNVGEVDAQHVGGVLATATHGSGKTGSFASMLVSAKLLLASGEIIQVSSTENAQYLDAVRTNLGCLGIVLEATLAVREAFNILKYEKILPTDKAIAHAGRFLSLSDPSSKNKITFLPYSHQHMYAAKDEVISEPSFVDRARNPIKAAVERITLSLVMNTAKSAPIALKPLIVKVALGGFNDRSYQVGKSFQLLEFAHDPLFKVVAGHVESEIAIPIEKLEDAVRSLFDLMEQKKFKVNGYVLARTVASETAWLSPAHGRDSVFLTFAHFRNGSDDWKSALAEMEAFMIEKYEGRPHWGKINFTNQAYARKAYPKYDDFARVRRELDPAGMFANDFVRRHFSVDDVERVRLQRGDGEPREGLLH